MRTPIEEKQKELIEALREQVQLVAGDEWRDIEGFGYKALALSQKITTIENELAALESSDNGEYFRKVIVKSVEDLPEKGEYFCNRSGFMTVQNMNKNLPDKSYQREIRWFLQPLAGEKGQLKQDEPLIKKSGENLNKVAPSGAEEMYDGIVTIQQRAEEIFNKPFNGHPSREGEHKLKEAVMFLAKELDILHRYRIRGNANQRTNR